MIRHQCYPETLHEGRGHDHDDEADWAVSIHLPIPNVVFCFVLCVMGTCCVIPPMAGHFVSYVYAVCYGC